MHILIMTGLTIATLTDEQLASIQEAAGADAEVTVVNSPKEALPHAAETDILFGALNQEFFAAAPNLAWVHAIASGVDAMLFPAFRDSAIPLTSEKGLVGPHLADHAMALLLALTRQVGQAIKDGPRSWENRVQYRQVEVELSGMTMGIVGFGGTGKALAQRAAGFVYLVSVTGVTGARSALPSDLVDFVGRVRRATELPLAVGFGISNPEQVATVGELCEAAVVGSAVISTVEQAPPGQRVAALRRFAEVMTGRGREQDA